MNRRKRATRVRVAASAIGLSLAAVAGAMAQTTSLRIRERDRATAAAGANPRLQEDRVGNPVLEQWSLSAVKVKPPKKFAVHDLVTIIVREQRKYESDGELETKKQFDLRTTVNAFLKPDDGLLGAATFPNGRPNIDFKNQNNVKNESDKEREDKLTTRITAQVLDIKPNGNLLLEARAEVAFDEEMSVITMSGVARSQDITADNTVLSTQLADKCIVVNNSGAVHDGSARGWITKLLDAARPF